MLIFKTIQTMMGGKIKSCNWLLIIGIAFFSLHACGEKKLSSNSKIQPEQSLAQNDTMASLIANEDSNTVYMRDTSVCNIALDSYTSIEREFGDVMGDSISKINGYEVFYFSNISKSEYLKLIFFPGNTQNAFSRFVISEVEARPINRRLNVAQCPVFTTESGIKLGITLDELEKIKGTEYLTTEKDSSDVYTYSIMSDINSAFYRRYRMPIYSAVYRFKNNRLVEFEFGFENP